MKNQYDKVKVFARVGVTLELTKEEITEFLTGYDAMSAQESSAILRDAFIDGRVTIGGDTYIPCPSIDDVNEELGTDYEPGEYEFTCPDGAKILLDKQSSVVWDNGNSCGRRRCGSRPIDSKPMPSAETGAWVRITHTLRQCSWCGAVSLGGEKCHACKTCMRETYRD